MIKDLKASLKHPLVIGSLLFTAILAILATLFPNRVLINVGKSLPFHVGIQLSRPPERGDIVTFRTQKEQEPWPNGTLFGKKLVGLPGDAVSCLDGTCRINGQIVCETDYHGTKPFWNEDIVLSPGQVFVVGTHRQSFDSRHFGPIAAQRLIGPVYVLF